MSKSVPEAAPEASSSRLSARRLFTGSAPRRHAIGAAAALGCAAWLAIAPAMAAAQGTPRVALVSTANKLLAHDGSYAPEFAQISADVKKVQVTGDRVVLLATNGDLWARDGALAPQWSFLSHDVKDFAVAGKRIAMIDFSNTLWARDGVLAPQWSYLSRDVAKVVLSGQRILMIATNNDLWGRDGVLQPSWSYLSHDVKDVAASGSRVAMVATDGGVWMRDGALQPSWVQQASSGRKVALSGTRLLVVTTSAQLWGRDTDTSGWGYMSADVADVSADEATTLMRATNNDLWVQDGAISATWNFLSHDTVSAGVAHRYSTSWAYGGDDVTVNTDAEADAAIAALRASGSDSAASPIRASLTPADQTTVTQRLQATTPTSGTYGGTDASVDTSAEKASLTSAINSADEAGAAALWSGLSAADQAALQYLSPGETGSAADPGTVSFPPDAFGGGLKIAAGSSSLTQYGMSGLAVGAPNGWCAGHLTGEGTAWSNEHKYALLSSYGPATFKVKIGGYVFDCDNGHSRVYYRLEQDTKPLPDVVDGPGVQYQLQMWRKDGQNKPITDLTDLRDSYSTVGQAIVMQSLPYMEMWPQAGKTTAAKMATIKMVLGPTPNSGTSMVNHVISATFDYNQIP